MENLPTSQSYYEYIPTYMQVEIEINTWQNILDN